MRVLVTGAAGELGWRVASILEADPRVSHIWGLDREPPTRRLRRTETAAIDPRDRRKVIAHVRKLAPTAIVHLGVYEPDARTSASLAADQTRDNALEVLGAAADLGELQRIVVRSGLDVYGRKRQSVTVPDEQVVPDPTSPFGRSLFEVEELAVASGRSADIPVATLRFAPLMGPGFPSPLARLLLRPVVPCALTSNPTFSVLHADDAARAVVAALWAGIDEPLNVVGPGAVTVRQAIRLGGRMPMPVAPTAWPLVRSLSHWAGAPIPDHILELLLRGRTGDGARAQAVLGLTDLQSTEDVIRAAHAWGPIPLRLAGEGKDDSEVEAPHAGPNPHRRSTG